MFKFLIFISKLISEFFYILFFRFSMNQAKLRLFGLGGSCPSIVVVVGGVSLATRRLCSTRWRVVEAVAGPIVVVRGSIGIGVAVPCRLTAPAAAVARVRVAAAVGACP